MTKLMRILIVVISTLLLATAAVYAEDNPTADIGATVNGYSMCKLTVVDGDSFTGIKDTTHEKGAIIPIGAIDLLLEDTAVVPTDDVGFLNVKIVDPPDRYGTGLGKQYQVFIKDYDWNPGLDGDVDADFGGLTEFAITSGDNPILFYNGATGSILSGDFLANLEIRANAGKRIYGGEDETLTIQYTLVDN